jgi:hypothetical protein
VVTLAEILRRYGPAYRAQFRNQLLPSQLRAMWAIEHCRTPSLGGHIYHCTECDTTHYRYHSCCNRHCNQCENAKGAEWLDKQSALLLPVPHHLVTFTLPAELRSLAYRHQKQVYNLLFRTAAEALQMLAADPRFVGGQIGLIGLLHTWQRNLLFHPHIHFLVPSGALDWVNDIWHRAPNHFFVHVKPLMLRFRANFRKGLKRLGLLDEVPPSVWQKPWVVHSQPAGHGQRALAYMADYLFRVAISNTRIVKVENDSVTFWYIEGKTGRRITCTLPAEAFITRFLQHVLPKRFVKVRYYGFYAAANRARLALVREMLGAQQHHASTATQANVAAKVDIGQQLTCPTCGQPMAHVGHLPRGVRTNSVRARSPPTSIKK